MFLIFVAKTTTKIGITNHSDYHGNQQINERKIDALL